MTKSINYPSQSEKTQIIQLAIYILIRLVISNRKWMLRSSMNKIQFNFAYSVTVHNHIAEDDA